MALPANLATNDIIDEVWVDAVTTELTALPGRYAPIALGKVAFAEKMVNLAGIGTTMSNIPGLSVTFTAVAGRRYRTSAFCGAIIQAAGSAGVCVMYLTNGSTTSFAESDQSTASGESHGSSVSRIETFAAGSVTRSVACRTTAGTVSFYSDANMPAYILVEDIGT